MPRYIEEKDIYNLFDARGVAQLHVGDIDVLPRAEVKPVVHAKWKLLSEGRAICRGCNFTQTGIWDYDHYQRFCGVCGAEMELEE